MNTGVYLNNAVSRPVGVTEHRDQMPPTCVLYEYVLKYRKTWWNNDKISIYRNRTV